ncbi:DUF4405 domain-containing protein [Mucisphaera calidilacus]|uniref:Flavinylation-associated cytochrome domain-containing protein n=1 Tax=Mucisphaera calidilacus TaxID=2527982 RepID=A0A518BTS7_9BACT|nr:DUF4405 domain-containing protein [Mucisphaera calidilacus]QDU70376.1 hypothetical protein Pan265_02020 [Mucisphaera calidilacus]
MKRNTLNALIDAALAVCMLILMLTGLLIAFVLPHGHGGGGGGGRATLWGLTRHGYGDIHLWASYVAIGLVLVHLMTHWSWVLITVRRMIWPSSKGAPSLMTQLTTGLAALTLLVVLTLGLGWVARASVERDDSSRRGGGRWEQSMMVDEQGERGAGDRQERRRGEW